MRKKNSIIENWLDEHGDPEIDQYVSKNLAIVHKVRAFLKKENISNQHLAERMQKRPSEVSKWLSGMHNLTLKSIVKMEIALGIDLIHTTPIKEYEYVYLGAIQSREEYVNKVNNYEPTFEGQEYSIAL